MDHEKYFHLRLHHLTNEVENFIKTNVYWCYRVVNLLYSAWYIDRVFLLLTRKQRQRLVKNIVYLAMLPLTMLQTKRDIFDIYRVRREWFIYPPVIYNLADCMAFYFRILCVFTSFQSLRMIVKFFSVLKYIYIILLQVFI